MTDNHARGPASTEAVPFHHSTLRLVTADLTTLDVEAFVFYARPTLELGSGFGSAIARRGGMSLRELLGVAPGWAGGLTDEQYVREIAGRLHVSESAVAEALAKVPVAREASATGASINTGDSRKERSSFARKPMDHGRAKQAYAIFLWQQSLEKPIVNINKFAKDLSEALGVEAFSVLGTLSEDEKESLRFRAESMYGKNTTLKREVEALLHVISHERLSADLREATAALKNAEVTGNEEDVAVYMSVCKLLTARIAQLHEPV